MIKLKIESIRKLRHSYRHRQGTSDKTAGVTRRSYLVICEGTPRGAVLNGIKLLLLPPTNVIILTYRI